MNARHNIRWTLEWFPEHLPGERRLRGHCGVCLKAFEVPVMLDTWSEWQNRTGRAPKDSEWGQKIVESFKYTACTK